MAKLERARSALLVVDMQTRLLPVMANRNALIRNCDRLCDLARRLETPAAISEHCSGSLGSTAPELREAFDSETIFEKSSFSCLGEEALRNWLLTGGRDQIVLCGIEAHVCVLQTALDLLSAGRQVFVTADAVSSRTPQSAEFGLERARQAGAKIVTFEMVFFEWLERAGTPEFRNLAGLVKG